jgi:hypothetical protein
MVAAEEDSSARRVRGDQVQVYRQTEVRPAYEMSNPYNPLNQFNPRSPLNPLKEYNPTTPFQLLNPSR